MASVLHAKRDVANSLSRYLTSFTKRVGDREIIKLIKYADIVTLGNSETK